MFYGTFKNSEHMYSHISSKQENMFYGTKNLNLHHKFFMIYV